jgi:DNA-directed RNA polymerase subunit RPC12/RpoP
VRKEEKRMADEFLRCPKCSSIFFIEWARQLTFQRGVRFDLKGRPDYEDADCNEFSDDCKIEGYQCDQCKTDLLLKGGVLIVEE